MLCLLFLLLLLYPVVQGLLRQTQLVQRQHVTVTAALEKTSFMNSKCCRYSSQTVSKRYRLFSADKDIDNIPDDPILQAYLKGEIARPWKGSRTLLERRKQVPNPEYSPQQAIQMCLNALQLNDDPQLDHGSSVVLELKSPEGALASSGLDPAGYGKFLRSTEYEGLIDFATSEFIGTPEELQDSLSIRQRVRITKKDINNVVTTKQFSFFLSKVGDCWLIDMIVLDQE